VATNGKAIRKVLVLGSGPDAVRARDWDAHLFDEIVAINNAWQVRGDWTYLIYPEDFEADRLPDTIDAERQTFVTAENYVPVQNGYGGFVYAGGTMAFTAGYWALGELRPDVLAFLGCDMVYNGGRTHFYGTGEPDPLRDDITLQSLEGKSARLMLTAAGQDCLCVNLSAEEESRLVFPRHDVGELSGWDKAKLARQLKSMNARTEFERLHDARAMEARLGYFVESGRYWEVAERFDAGKLLELDQRWLGAAEHRPSKPIP
jgi:hypothetical protein